MNLTYFENLVLSYLQEKNEYLFNDILTALRGYIITVATNTYLQHYDYNDIVQELEFTVFTALSKYNINSNKAWGYLTTCVKNKMYELYSIDKKITNIDTAILEYSNYNAFSSLDTNLLDEYRTSALSDIEYSILDLYYVNSLSIADIALQLNKSISFISKKKRSALSKLSCSFN